MITRTRDAALLNRIASKQGQAGDFSELLSEPLHVCLVEGDSAAFFAWRGPGIYEVHLLFSVRGRAAIDLLRLMLGRMCFDHGATLFWALVPVSRRDVRLFARWMGWRSHGEIRSLQGPHELFSKG